MKLAVDSGSSSRGLRFFGNLLNDSRFRNLGADLQAGAGRQKEQSVCLIDMAEADQSADLAVVLQTLSEACPR